MTKRPRRGNPQSRRPTTRVAPHLQIADPNRPVGLEPIPFPGRCTGTTLPRRRGESATTGNEVFAAFDTVSRRMDDLARALDCLGFFDDGDDDRPRAA